MPSPFPGMDPYLEAPDIWPDVHESLATEIRAALNATLPPPYYARLEMRPEVGIVDDEGPARRIVPDVAVARWPSQDSGDTQGTALATPRKVLSKSLEVTVSAESLRHQYVEIRDPTRGHRLITLLEIVSPSNKRPGPDRRAYLQKQREILDSDANLIELDLLRSGERLLPHPELEVYVGNLSPDYLVLVNRAWRRVGVAGAYQLFPVALPDPLPCFPVPLREGQEEVPLDLQFLFNRVYDTGPYQRGAVDYRQPPRPPLKAEAAAWAEQRVRDWLAGPPAAP